MTLIKHDMSELEAFIAQHGTDLSPYGTNAFALRRQDALAVLRLAETSEALILGGDVMRRENENFTPTLDVWHCDPQPRELLAEFQRRSIVTAQEYIQNYADPGDGSIAFVLVLAKSLP